MTALNNQMSVEGINDIETIGTLYHEFFTKKTYDWWYKVKSGDTVVDIGSCNGMFTCDALDKGAKKVYAVEPNTVLLNTTFKNAWEHVVNKPVSPLSLINCFIGTNENPFGIADTTNVPTKSFKELIQLIDEPWIDYLKIDCEGGEFDIFKEENIHYLINHVGHMAIEFHLDAYPNAPQEFINIRDNIFPKFKHIRFLNEAHKEKTYNDDWITSKWPLGWGSCWMVYITNH